MNRGLELKSLKRIFLLFILSLSTLAGATFFYIFSDAKRDRINDLTYISTVIKGYYELSFHQWELSLLSVGNRLIEIADAEERLKYAKRALKVYEKELLAFGLAEPNGQIITFTDEDSKDAFPNLMGSPKTRRSFEYALLQNGISLGECYFFENLNDWILPIRVPILNQNGELVAVNTSAIDYRSMIADFKQFGFDDRYRIHLINRTFGTTQIYYPLERAMYEQVLGSDGLHYTIQDSLRLNEDSHLIESFDPLTEAAIYSVCTQIQPVNHQLFVTIDKSVLVQDVMARFRYVLYIYLFLIVASLILFRYLRQKFQLSIQKIRLERANLKSLIGSTDDIIGLFDVDKKLLAFNRAFEVSAQMTDNIILHEGMDIFAEMKSKEYAEIFSKNFERALGGERFRDITTYPGPDGEIVFRFTYNPIYQDDEIKGVSMFAEDITEIRKYQEQLEEYNKNLEETVKKRTQELESKNHELKEGYEKLKSTQQQLIRAEKMASLGILSAGIGHEINNPLNFIKHGSIALKMKLDQIKVSSEVSLDDYFHAIDEGVRRASDIVSGLSHFSRSGDNFDEICKIHPILSNCLTILKNRFRDKEIEIITNFNAQKDEVVGNDGQLHQVFTNIIVNAEQAIAANGRIEITTENEGHSLMVFIKDTGSGMSEEVIGKLMDPFFTTKEPGEGTGLGMFITQMIIDEHKGKIDVESKVGVGTTFTIILESK